MIDIPVQEKHNIISIFVPISFVGPGGKWDVLATADPRLVLLTFLERISGPSVSQCETTFFQPTELIRFEKTTKLREIPDKSI